MIGRIDELARALTSLGFRGEVAPGCPLAPYTTYEVGGPADLALLPLDGPDLALAVGVLAARGLRPVVLGGGSNVLVSDRGVRGVVVVTSRMDRIDVVGEHLCAGAGAASHAVAEAARAAGLAGAEFLTCLPGSVGGACFMNARAYDGEVSRVLERVEVVSASGELGERRLSPEMFAYKRSPFQDSGEVVTRATLSLRRGDPARIRDRMAHIEGARRAKHELDHPSCGCVFKNDRAVGVPSGQLIERCGLKGTRRGAAQVSIHHANFVWNLGGATAADLLWLMEHVRATVEARTGHRLAYEVRLLGQWEADAALRSGARAAVTARAPGA